MAEEETQPQTEEATQDGAETDGNADTKDATQDERQFTQSELDSRTSAGIKAYIEKREVESEEQRKQDEQIAAIKDGKFEEALKYTQAKLDALEAAQTDKDYKLEAQGVLVKLGMSHFTDALIPGTKTIDELLQRAEAFKSGLEQGIEQGVNERLNTGPTRTPASTHKTPDKTPDKMDREEFAAFKIAHGLV